MNLTYQSFSEDPIFKKILKKMSGLKHNGKKQEEKKRKECTK